MAGSESVFAVAAHPDDDVIGCGASLAQHAEAGDDVHVVYLTSGENGNREYSPTILGPLREAEATEAAAILGLGATSLTFLRFNDKTLASSAVERDAAAKLVPLLQDRNPTLVYVPHAEDGHPDHEAAFRIVRASLAMSRLTPRMRGFEIWEELDPPDEIVAISSRLLERKKAAMRVHRSQMLKMDYVSFIDRRAQARGGSSNAYAEAFRLYQTGEH